MHLKYPTICIVIQLSLWLLLKQNNTKHSSCEFHQRESDSITQQVKCETVNAVDY